MATSVSDDVILPDDRMFMRHLGSFRILLLYNIQSHPDVRAMVHLCRCAFDIGISRESDPLSHILAELLLKSVATGANVLPGWCSKKQNIIRACHISFQVVIYTCRLSAKKPLSGQQYILFRDIQISELVRKDIMRVE